MGEAVHPASPAATTLVGRHAELAAVRRMVAGVLAGTQRRAEI